VSEASRTGSAQNDKNDLVERSFGCNLGDFANAACCSRVDVTFAAASKILSDKCAGAGERAAAGLKPSIP
jgi:hypothetical protein